MRAADPRVSYAELVTWPDTGRRYELYEGEVIELSAPVVRHQGVVTEVMNIFLSYRRMHGGQVFCSPVDVVLSQYDVFQPDVVWVGSSRLDLINVDGPMDFIPDLAVEVLSRSTGVRDRGRKRAIFGKHGLPEYWLIDPVAKSLEIYTNNSGWLQLAGAYSSEDNVASPTLPDLRFLAGQLFDRPRLG